MKKALYVYGYGSNSNSETRANLQEILGPEWTVDSVDYPQDFPDRGIKLLSETAKNYDAVIGSSLGGFYVLQMDYPGQKVVINPCMKPSIELPKIGCPAEIASRFAEFEKYEHNKHTLGLFGSHDELIDYKEMFSKEVSQKIIVFPSGHRPSLEQLRKVKDIIFCFVY